jgi:protein-S-isoprenylcysteine O-methyltransferase Ste14
MVRIVGLIYGVVIYLFFLAVFLYTIGFVGNLPQLPKAIDVGGSTAWPAAVVIDVLLLGLFAVQHSVMARLGFKRRWTRIVPESAERSTFVLAASLVIALMLWQWRPLPTVVWNVHGRAAEAALHAMFALGWVTVLAATFLINHFELFGLQQSYDAWRGRRFEPPAFKTPGLYRWVRHPIYLGFVLAFWATPRMTQGHLLFAAATTAYIFVGILFEERDLIARFGELYRDYRRSVPMLVPLLSLRRGRSRPSPGLGSTARTRTD